MALDRKFNSHNAESCGIEARRAVNLAASEWRLGNYARAERWLNRALHGYELVLGAADSSLGYLYQGLAVVRNAQGKYTAAEHAVRRALALWSPNHAADSAKSASLLASIEANRKHYRESAAQYEAAIRMIEQSLGNSDPLLIGILADYAAVSLALDRNADGETLSRRAVVLAEAGVEPRLDWARAEWTLARALSAQGQLSEADPHFRRALELFRAAPQFDAARLEAATSDYVHALQRSHRLQEASQVKSEAFALLAVRKGTVSVSEIPCAR